MAQARARVTLTLVVDVPDVWGDDCPISQVRAQGAAAAIGNICKALGMRADDPLGRGAYHLVPQSVRVETVIVGEDGRP